MSETPFAIQTASLGSRLSTDSSSLSPTDGSFGLSSSPGLDDAIVQEALASGLDLRQYSRQIGDQLKCVENEAIQDYIKESSNIASLHNQLQNCDDILARMENILTLFQSDLGSISNEIQVLQEQSIEMDVKLRNRQSVRGELSQFVDEMVVPEMMINHVMETPVSEREFIEQLHELQHKINFAKEQSFREVTSASDVCDILEKLRLKAVAKIREFFLLKISQFRKPLSNYQIPQNTMLKYRFCFEFLMANERQIAKEVRDEYVDSVSKMFHTYFKTYGGRLMRLLYDDCATKDDVLGAEDTNKSSAMSMSNLFGQKPAIRNRATVFTLGNRASVIETDLEAPIIVPHASQQAAQKYALETLFRSLEFAFLDNACREYLFLCDFFMTTAGSNAALELFGQVMGKAMTAVTKAVDGVVSASYDSIGLVLCISVVNCYQQLTHKRGASVLDSHWETLLNLLWPRFEHVMQLNIDSVRDATAHKVGSPDPMRPHYIIRRYAELSAAMAEISRISADQRLSNVFLRLQDPIEKFLLRLAAEFTDRKKHLIFLINNYDLLLSVLSGTSSGSNKADGVDAFRELLAVKTDEFIDEILFPHFGALTHFVKETEPLLEANDVAHLKDYGDKVSKIIKAFNASWKKALEAINQEVMQSFPNYQNGSSILQAALTKLLQHYQRFSKILSSPAFASLPARNELINLHHVMVEVKKHKSNF